MIKKLLYKLVSHVLWMRPYYLFKKVDEIGGSNTIAQLQLAQTYRNTVAHGLPLPSIQDAAFRVYSENGEDGMLLLLFAAIGTTNKVAVEVCAGDGITNCTANLLVHHGWQGFLFEGNPERVALARQFYKSHASTHAWPPCIAQEWITPEGVNSLFEKHGVPQEVDLFSLDLDSLDYWVWERIDRISPRVFICETNNLWPAERAVTIPNNTDFRPNYNGPYGADYSGASLGAFIKLSARKGYRLVALEKLGYNAIFMRNDVGMDLFPAIDPVPFLQHPFSVHARTERHKNVKDMPWVDVERSN